VALGMYAITVKSEEMGITESGTYKNIKEIIEKYNLEYKIELKYKEKILEAVALDKKNKGDFMNVILLSHIGEGFIHKIKREEMHKFI
jgi:3-dehydroquinate synthase